MSTETQPPRPRIRMHARRDETVDLLQALREHPAHAFTGDKLKIERINTLQEDLDRIDRAWLHLSFLKPDHAEYYAAQHRQAEEQILSLCIALDLPGVQV
jgi:hypothetical protein